MDTVTVTATTGISKVGVQVMKSNHATGEVVPLSDPFRYATRYGLYSEMDADHVALNIADLYEGLLPEEYFPVAGLYMSRNGDMYEELLRDLGMAE